MCLPALLSSRSCLCSELVALPLAHSTSLHLPPLLSGDTSLSFLVVQSPLCLPPARIFMPTLPAPE